MLCRLEAQKVWDLKDQLDSMGVGLVALVHERLPDEVRPSTTGWLTCCPLGARSS